MRAMTRRVSKSITAHDSLVRLHRHVHQTAHHSGHRNNLGSIDIGINIDVLVALQDHGDFLERCITRTLTDTIHGHLHLAGTIQYTLQGIGSSHTEIVVTVGRDACLLDAIHMLHQILDLVAILFGIGMDVGHQSGTGHAAVTIKVNQNLTGGLKHFCFEGIFINFQHN